MVQFGPILFLFLWFAGGRLLAGEGAPLERRFQVGDGSTLRVDLFAGAIKVTPSAQTHEIVLKVRTEASGGRPGAAQRWVDGVTVETEQEGNLLQVTVRHRQGSVSVDLGEKPTGLVRLEITVPLRTHLDLKAGSFSIETGHDLEGDVRIRAATGTVFLGRTRGRIDVEVDDGNLTVSRATGTVALRTYRGDIRVGTLLDFGTLETGSGNISIFSAERGIRAKASAGDIEATVGAGLSEDSALTTAGGNIRVAFNAQASLLVRARSVWGRVEARLPITPSSGGPGQRRLEGPLNRGGSTLTLHASGGNVLMTSLPADEG